MNKKIIKGLLTALGVILLLWMAFPFGIILSLAFWIYLGVLIWKKKPVFKDEIEPVLAEKLLKRLNLYRIAALITFPIGIAGVIIHNIRSARLGTEDALFFFIGVIVSFLFILASACGIITFIKGRQNPEL